MSNLILYSYWRSSCSYRVRIALHLKKLDFEYRPVHLVREGGEQHSAAYAALNPSEEVPCLVHEGRALSQSMAILQYLDHLQPSPRLFPKDPWQAAQVLALAESINTGIQPIQNLSVLQEIDTLYKAGPSGKASWAAHWIQRGFEALEKKLVHTAGTFAFGDRVSVVDAFLVPQVYNANRFKLDMSQFPAIDAVNAHCMSLEAFQKAEPAQQPDAVV